MKKRITYQIDSFTKEKFRGNPAGVVLNADGLTDSEMQALARELNNSETAFLFPPDASDCDCMIRYFTPTIEVPSCGHATIAALYAKAHEEQLAPGTLRAKTKIGVLPIEIAQHNGDYQITMTQGKFELAPPLNDAVSHELLTALGLVEADRDNKCPIQIASTGHSKVMIGITSREKMNALKPNLAALAELSKRIQCNGYFVFTFDSNNSDILTHGRMFAPAIGISEDPVTGNANGPLGGYLVQNKIASYQGNTFKFNGSQGEAIGRNGIVQVSVTVENETPVSVRIKGDAVIIFRTEITL
ncbi:PhzF family isomerase [Chryseolinea lacunae]|uniref:PhzF family isomerase n=1 Tax=Chryseolinea lacunae TaxID=2801331 RepID=A0ABS1KKW7_9BACT|nr:PhzF family isomerase [Chryseolinea lacunae]MBL0739988.1 PhzF family isomerase [Chryseolinea lacunae]